MGHFGVTVLERIARVREVLDQVEKLAAAEQPPAPGQRRRLDAQILRAAVTLSEEAAGLAVMFFGPTSPPV